jgi:hypothetical protein
VVSRHHALDCADDGKKPYSESNVLFVLFSMRKVWMILVGWGYDGLRHKRAEAARARGYGNFPQAAEGSAASGRLIGCVHIAATGKITGHCCK